MRGRAPVSRAELQRLAWTGSGLDILQHTCDFFGSGLDLDIHFWIHLDQDRNRILVWFLQLNFPESDSRCDNWWWQCFLCYIMNFILSIQYVLGSSQSMVIRFTLSLIFSHQVEVVSCFYIAGMLFCLLYWMSCVCCVA